MRVLIMDEAVQERVNRVVAYAFEHIMREGETGDDFAVEDSAFYCVVPVGLGCGFTVEQRPNGLARHLSVRLLEAAPGKIVHPMAVSELMRMFGFKGNLLAFDENHPVMVWHDVCADGGRVVVNVLELVEPEPPTDSVAMAI